MMLFDGPETADDMTDEFDIAKTRFAASAIRASVDCSSLEAMSS